MAGKRANTVSHEGSAVAARGRHRLNWLKQALHNVARRISSTGRQRLHVPSASGLALNAADGG
ncbi:hypothetical protein ACFQGX_50040 [Nonomuraea dietziae]|uniref:hypothetical protein n=1 Tax=Nonomuraea dietziae TaxID=65515 RepID=UPI00360E4D4D